jgi:hypothetical protein
MSRQCPVVVALVTAALFVPPIGAGAANLPDFAGTYRQVDSVSAIRAMDETVTKVLSGLNPLVLLVARGQLTKALKLPERLQILVAGPDLTIRKDALPSSPTPADGTVKAFTFQGKPVRLGRRLAGQTITESAYSEDGSRTMVFTLSGGGETLAVTSTLRSKRLGKPVKVSGTYRRSGS